MSYTLNNGYHTQTYVLSPVNRSSHVSYVVNKWEVSKAYSNASSTSQSCIQACNGNNKLCGHQVMRHGGSKQNVYLYYCI